MRIPKDIQGKEVERAIDLLGRSVFIETELLKGGEYIKDHYDTIHFQSECWYFYMQPFNVEVIKKYFEGWEKINHLYYEHNEFTFSDYSGEWGENCFLIDKDGSSLFMGTIKTLSDFIDACLNSDIKLKWKSE